VSDHDLPPVTRATAAAGALFFDRDDRVLLVQPTYKEQREIPGGHVEPGETPYQACVREVREELGIEPPIGRLLVADWAPHPTRGDKILFVFDGDELDAGTLERIRFADGELSAYGFYPVGELDELLIDRLARRVKAAVVARELGETVYLEHGRAVTASDVAVDDGERELTRVSLRAVDGGEAVLGPQQRGVRVDRAEDREAAGARVLDEVGQGRRGEDAGQADAPGGDLLFVLGPEAVQDLQGALLGGAALAPVGDEGESPALGPGAGEGGAQGVVQLGGVLDGESAVLTGVDERPVRVVYQEAHEARLLTRMGRGGGRPQDIERCRRRAEAARSGGRG
jgi:8-oxo-dGTP diphosphatase